MNFGPIYKEPVWQNPSVIRDNHHAVLLNGEQISIL